MLVYNIFIDWGLVCFSLLFYGSLAVVEMECIYSEWYFLCMSPRSISDSCRAPCSWFLLFSRLFIRSFHFISVLHHGSCLCRSASFLCCGEEHDMNMELCVRIVIELARHADLYTILSYLIRKSFSWMAIWSIHALASVMKRVIWSIYPGSGEPR